VSLRDVRERKQMDETRSRLAAIVESSEDAIISMTDHGIIQSWNRGAERLHGFIAEEMIGQSISLVIPEGKADEENETFERILRGETVEPYETIRKHKSGKSIDVSLTISPIRDGSGKIVGASKIARNITERKNLERQLHQSRRMEAIGQLTSGIAHDFNNLLCVIQGNLGLLEPLLKDNVVALKRVRTAKKASARGADVIRRLMSFSSNAELKAAPGSLNESVRNLVEWSPALGPDIKIATDLNELMPPVFVDAAGLESALLNLAVNARDAMPKGGTLTITTNLTTLEEDYPPVLTGELKAGRYAYISISDTGHGMSQETLERVFEPFFTTKPRNKGTGLGLAMVYGFAKQSKGAARIYSEIDYGTTVTLYLPLAEETPEPVLARELGHTPAKVSGAVLVVDDEEDLVEIARAFLEEMGYTTYHARDGASALAVVEQHNDIDLIVTDILMPGGMNGVELTEKIRESLEQVKVIYCSGFPANALAERNMSLIDGPLLLKPYQRAEFTTAVRAVMDAPR
jgi:PAS domain S-box-containing protein